jgi:hypothetical protein
VPRGSALKKAWIARSSPLQRHRLAQAGTGPMTTELARQGAAADGSLDINAAFLEEQP